MSDAMSDAMSNGMPSGTENDLPMSEVPAIAAARRFDVQRHRRFFIDETPVGWIRLDDIERLARWPAVFSMRGDAVLLSPLLDSVEKRTDALGQVIRVLADEGRITGWRDETFAIRNAFDDPPMAFIERAASRLFGTMTYAVHVNGLIDKAIALSTLTPTPVSASVPTFTAGDDCDLASESAAVNLNRLWIARRSHSKAVDPGMLDTLVGGGIGWGWSIEQTLIKECAEESGITETLARQSVPGRTIHVLAEIEEGTQAEQLFVYDLVLPVDFRPTAMDGEVAEHLDVNVDQALLAIASGRMTVDASLASLDCALRRGWLSSADLPGFIRLYTPPMPGIR